MSHKDLTGQFFRIWRQDYHFQTLLSAAVSLGCTALFAVYSGYLGLCHGSMWHSGIGVFYFLLMTIRGMILLTEHRNRRKSKNEQDLCRRRIFLVSSVLLLILDLALILPIAMMVVMDKPVTMGLIPAIAMGAYTTWKITMASIHIRRQRHRSGGNLLVAALRTINFIDALVAILTLQNTLIMVAGAETDGNRMLPVSAVSSALIYVWILLITIGMLCRGLRQKQSLPPR